MKIVDGRSGAWNSAAGVRGPRREDSLRRVAGLLIVVLGLSWPALASAQSGASQLIQQLGGQAIQVLQTTGGSLD